MVLSMTGQSKQPIRRATARKLNSWEEKTIIFQLTIQATLPVFCHSYLIPITPTNYCSTVIRFTGIKMPCSKHPEITQKQRFFTGSTKLPYQMVLLPATF